MINDREKLSEHLIELFILNNANNKLREKLQDELEDKFESGEVVRIYNLKRQLIFLSEEQLYLITNKIYENYNLIYEYFENKKLKYDKKTNIKKEDINPDNWFTETEKRNANAIKIQKKSKGDNDYFILHNVDQVKDGVWISSHETIQNIVDNWERGTLEYNPDTQRKGKIKFIAGQSVKIPKLVDRNVEEIKKAILNNEFFMNMITVNIQEFGGEEKQYIEYDEKNRILRVKKTDVSNTYLIDGGHRTSAAKKALAENPEIEASFIVRVLNLDVNSAQEAIVQEQKGTPLDKETIKYFDKKSVYTSIAEKINTLGSEATNSMYHKISSTIEEVNYNQKYCLFSNVINGLEDNFSDIIENANPYKIDKLSRYLIDFYNVFLGMFDEYFRDLKTTKPNTVIADINIFTGLLVLAKQLFQDEDWQNKLEKILKEINWEKTNKEWEDIPTKSLNFNKTTKTKIYNYFIEKLEMIGVA